MKIRKALVSALVVVGASAAGYGVASAGASSPVPSNQPASGRTFASTAPTVTESSYVPIRNCRIVATATAGGRIPANTARAFYVKGTVGFPGQGGTSGGCGIPAAATAVSARLTGGAVTAAGAFVAYPSGAPIGSGTLYYAKGLNLTTGATLQLAAGTGKVLTVRNVAGSAQLTIDVNGYFVPPINAFVETNGTITFSSGRAISSSHPSTGNYVVTFDRDVSRCTYSATPYAYNYVIAAGPQGGTPNAVHLYIHDQVSPFAQHDTSFHLTVSC